MKIIGKKQKSAQVRVRLSPAMKTGFVREAKRRGLSLSSWMVTTCFEALEAVEKKEPPP